jgi:uncharacterized membrane protein
MAFCSKCGTQLPEGAGFCPACGTGIDGERGDYGQNRPGGNAGGYSGPEADIADNKLIAVLCYFGLLFLIPYLARPNSPFVKYHSNQGLVLLLFALISGGVSNIPFIGWLIGTACGVFTFVCFILGIVAVCNGEMKELPLIGSIQILK